MSKRSVAFFQLFFFLAFPIARNKLIVGRWKLSFLHVKITFNAGKKWSAKVWERVLFSILVEIENRCEIPCDFVRINCASAWANVQCVRNFNTISIYCASKLIRKQHSFRLPFTLSSVLFFPNETEPLLVIKYLREMILWYIYFAWRTCANGTIFNSYLCWIYWGTRKYIYDTILWRKNRQNIDIDERKKTSNAKLNIIWPRVHFHACELRSHLVRYDIFFEFFFLFFLPLSLSPSLGNRHDSMDCRQ